MTSSAVSGNYTTICMSAAKHFTNRGRKLPSTKGLGSTRADSPTVSSSLQSQFVLASSCSSLPSQHQATCSTLKSTSGKRMQRTRCRCHKRLLSDWWSPTNVRVTTCTLTIFMRHFRFSIAVSKRHSLHRHPPQQPCSTAFQEPQVWVHANQGDLRYVHDGEVVSDQWMDKKPATVASIICVATGSDVCHRKASDANGQWHVIDIRRPTCIALYHASMGGVDVDDQHLAAFDIHWRSRRCWKALFLHLINFAVIQAYFLFMLCWAINPDEIVRPADYSAGNFALPLPGS